VRLRYLHRALKARFRDQRDEIRAAASLLQRGDIAVDIGANKGAYLYWLRRAVGSTGQVFAFEPQPTLAAYLRSIAARMQWPNVDVRECALSDAAGVGTLYVPGERESPGASLEPAALAAIDGHHYSCPIDTLDHQMGGTERIALLKVDVEGHELHVLRGAAGILKQHHPALLVECEARHLAAHTMDDVFAFLGELGYEGEFFSPGGRQPLSAFRASLHQRRGDGAFWNERDYCNNFLFRWMRR
jgi:FkbM family methyltransferase